MKKISLSLFILLIWFGCEDPNKDLDTNGPKTSILFPENNSVVSDTVIFVCESVDENQILRVELWINNDSSGITDNSEPYELKWITKGLENGTYNAFIKAYDTLGNYSSSDTVTLFLDNFLIFNKTFGNPNESEIGYAVIQTSDMGYAILGSIGKENKDICLLRTDYSGNELWFQTYGGSQHDEARHIKQTIDDGFIISGFTKSYGFGEEDAWIIKVDASGLMDWNAKFGTPGNDRASQVLQDDDGGYIIVGEKQSSNLDQSNLWILKINSQGELSWEKTYGGDGDDKGYDIRKEYNSFLLLGSTSSYGNGGHDIWLLNIDHNGNEIWSNTYGSSNNEYGRSIISTEDEGYLIFATSESFGNDNTDLHNIKVDSVGSQQWIKSFGGFYGKNGNVLQKSPIGGYVLISSRYSFNNNSYNMWLIKMDLNGDTEWTKTFGGLKNDYGFSIATTLDGGYVITGGTESYGFENADFSDLWFLKTDIDGNTLYP